ncbi:MAG: lysophospholipase [Clostridia bacterium]|nr:lysophospholipase [Clostridia bacterium]
MKTVLFQGDSITDAGRSRDQDSNLGRGYPHLIKAALNFREPQKYNFINRGISGNRIVDVYARIKLDIINLAPDFMSLPIGVNDVWHEFSRQNGVSEEKFEKVYSMLIEEIREALPNIKILVMEPFALPASATEGVLEDGSSKYSAFRLETEKRAAAAKRIAEKYSLEFLPLQKLLDDAAAATSPEYWLADGVHPTEAGHALIAAEWIKKFDAMKSD